MEEAAEKVKVIIVGNVEISPTLMKRLQEHYDRDIELVSIEEYNASRLTKGNFEQKKVNRVYVMEKPDMGHLYDLSKIPPIEIFNFPDVKRKTSKPYNPQKMGEVNSKSKISLQRCHNKRLRSR